MKKSENGFIEKENHSMRKEGLTIGKELKMEIQFLGNLRDYFAAAALDGLVHDWDLSGGDLSDVASCAYELADAMLKEREKQ
jgi:hypothetical protein